MTQYIISAVPRSTRSIGGRALFITRRLLLLSMAIILVSHGFTQNKISKDMDIANAYFGVSAYSYAIKYYTKAYEKQPNVQLAKKIADTYLLLRDYPEAERWFQKIESSPYIDDSTLSRYARVLTCLGRYSEAKRVYNQYLSVRPDKDSLVHQAMAWCDTAARWIANPTPYSIENLEQVNTRYSEICPVMNGISMYFSSSRLEDEYQTIDIRTGEGYYNIYYSAIQESKLTIPKRLFKKHTGAFHEIVSAFNASSDTLYYSKSAVVKNAQGREESRFRIFRAASSDGEWREPECFILNDSLYSYAQCAISANGRMFIFSSDMPGGYGKNDLYVSFRIDTTWTRPINLGGDINTPGDEIYPFFHDDGTLYFASDGLPGMGGFDIFSASLVDGEWTHITNLKSPINSCADDFSLYLNYDKTKGYLCSNRQGGKGAEDIYMVRIK